ncbi:MAG: MFS transporter [Planctomycetota bacterium]
MLWKLPPFRSLDNGKTVWAWSMYDLANQSFTLLIITLLFPLYFKEQVVGDPSRGDFLWSLAVGISQGIVVLTGPVLGALADCRGLKKRLLISLGIGCAILTLGLFFLEPDAIWLAFLLFVPANVAYQLGENFLASFLPHVAGEKNTGRISAIGWASGYVGALLLLIITLGCMFAFGWQDTSMWRPFFLLAGIWFLLGIIPTALILDEPSRSPLPSDSGSTVGAALTRMKRTIEQASHFKQLVRFLIAFFVFGLGVQVMVAFSSILAADFGIEGSMLVLFVAQLTITAGITAALTAKFQDGIGARNTVLIYLAVWIASCLGMAAITILIPNDPPQWLFWVIGNGIGIGLGGIGTASRTVVGRFSPKGRTAEFFGLWGLAYKSAAVVGVVSFGVVKSRGQGLLPFGNANTAALLLLTAFFVGGLLLTLRVSETAGVRAAKRADRGGARGY